MKFIISGGGTGGHIFPAIAIAQAIQRREPDAEILFVGAQGKMEMERVPKAGYKIEGLWISGFSRKLSLDLFSLPFKLISSWWKSRSILKKFKPNVVIGVGGYASAVIVRTAAKSGIPTVIHEQNSFAGLTNRTLGKSVNKVCVAASGMERFFPKEKMILTGNPIRQDIVSTENRRREAAKHFGLHSGMPTLLVVGGSLGARTINESIAQRLQDLQQAGVQVLWQCGKAYFDDYVFPVTNYSNVKLLPFIDKMDLAYAIADAVVARAGALTIAELCATQKAAILVPSPNVTDDHQTANAMSLVNENAAILVKDAEAREKLVPEAIALMNNHERRHELEAAVAKLAILDAADRIAEVVFGLAKQ